MPRRVASLWIVAAVSLNQHVDDFEARLRTHEGLLFEDDVYRLCNLMVTSSFGHGSQPAHRAVDLGTLKLGVTPRRCRVVRQLDNGWGTTRVLVGVDWVGVVRQRTTGETSVSVSATDPSIAEGVVEELKAKAIKPKRKPGTVDITFTHDGRAGTTRQTRAVPTPTWASIRRNYSAGAHTTLDALMAMTAGTLPSGRLILIHGPTGSGKSTLLRSLAHAWSEWCSTEFLLDPDRFLSQPSYLHDVALNNAGADHHEPHDAKWRLIVLEDCDEYLRTNAKSSGGQNFARLLNVADGVVSHGNRNLICMTTAEPVGAMHPAVRRPGRCIADLSLDRLSRYEAQAWLGRHPMPATEDPDGSVTLAELYAATSTPALTVDDEPYVVGVYL